MSTEAFSLFGETLEEAGRDVVYHWNERFEWLLEAVEVDGKMHWNPDFDDEVYDAKFDGGGNDNEAERMWRE